MKSPKTILFAIGLALAGLITSIFFLLNGDGSPGNVGVQKNQSSGGNDDVFSGKPGDYPGPLAPAPDGKIYIKKKSVIDLAYVKTELPNNLYWQLSEPTTDPDRLRERARNKARWNKVQGKIRSNTAEPEDIRIYYNHRKRVSEDYIAFMKFVLKKYGSKMKQNELSLYKVGLELHTARLKQIPRDTADALSRRAAYLEKKRKWASNR